LGNSGVERWDVWVLGACAAISVHASNDTPGVPRRSYG
jgi:hypothetical protein